jgi:surfeit locus 1 family protein
MSLVNRRTLPPLLTGLVGTAILIALCVWQVQRLEWKEGLIARLEARLAAKPRPIPDDPDPGAHEFLRVRVEGRLGEGVAHVLTTRRPYGPGFRVIAPVDTGGRRVLADLGYVPEARRGEALPAPGTPLTLTGALFWPQGGAAPEPDLEDMLFFDRSVPPLAGALGTAEILVVAESHSLGERPLPERLGVNLPNNHLNYAITWGSMAVVWAVMSVLWFRREAGRG